MSELRTDLEFILSKTGNIWPELNNCHLFITGGTGFFGRWLLESISFAVINLGLKMKVTVLTRNIEAFHSKAPHLFAHDFLFFQEGNITDFEFPEEPIQYIIHAATEADARLNAESPLVMVDTIVAGTRWVLELARLKNVKGLLLTSSGAIYGQQPTTITHVSEDFLGGPDISNPYWAYGESKRMAELLGAIYHKQFAVPVKIARCFAFVGPFLPLDTHFAIGNFIRNGLNQEPIVIKGDGTPYRSYLYAADLVIWLLHILIKGQNKQPYNVGSDEAISIKDLAQTVAEQFPDYQSPQILTEPKPGAEPERYVPAIKKVHEELNLQVYTPLKESIQKTIAFYQKIPI